MVASPIKPEIFPDFGPSALEQQHTRSRKVLPQNFRVGEKRSTLDTIMLRGPRAPLDEVMPHCPEGVCVQTTRGMFNNVDERLGLNASMIRLTSVNLRMTLTLCRPAKLAPHLSTAIRSETPFVPTAQLKNRSAAAASPRSDAIKSRVCPSRSHDLGNRTAQRHDQCGCTPEPHDQVRANTQQSYA